MGEKVAPKYPTLFTPSSEQPGGGFRFYWHVRERYAPLKFMSDTQLTIEQMPQVLASLEQKVDKLVNLVLDLTNSKGSEPDQWFDVDGLRAYHPDHPARKTIYDWVTLRRVPYHKDGKRLRFLKSVIDAWLAGGYHKTDDEMQEAAVDYVNAIRGGAR